MLNKRYYNDGKPAISLNKLQLRYKKIVEDKVNNKKYVLEKVNCIVCCSDNFEVLSEKDKFGLQAHVVICKKCGLIQTNPRKDQKSYEEYYNNEYRKLLTGIEKPNEESFKKQFIHGSEIYGFIEFVLKKPIKNKVVVEIGTGTGGILSFFKEKGNKVFGVDLVSEYINFGKRKGLNLATGTVKELSKSGIKPDLVIYSHVIEHLLNPVEELRILKGHLKQNSLVYIEVPSIKSLRYNPDFLEYLTHSHTYHFTLNSLVNCTKKAGFNLIFGNETVNSLFKVGKINKKYKNDYMLTMMFLKKLEKNSKKPLNIYKIKNKIFLFAYSIIRLTRTEKIARKMYYKYRGLRC